MENPAQLQAFRDCIEKCQALRKQGNIVHTTKSRTTLLLSYHDEMKTPASQQRRLKRASTTIERSRPAKKHVVKRKLSYQQSLPSIGEESMMNKKGVNREEEGEEEKPRKRSESRPTFLKFTSPSSRESGKKRPVVVMKGDDFKKRPLRSSTDELSTKGSAYFSSSDSLHKHSQSTSSVQGKKSMFRRHIANQNMATPLSPITSPPVETSPRRKGRRLKKTPKLTEETRNPPMSQLRDDSKFTSSEFQADVEDFDVISPEPIKSVGEKIKDLESSYTVAVNESAVSDIKHGSSDNTIEAEIHDVIQGKSPHLLHDDKQTSITSTSSLILPPPTSPRPSSRSVSPSLVPHQSPMLSPSSPLSHTIAPSTVSPVSDTISEKHNSLYSEDLNHSSDLLLPRQRSNSSPLPSPAENGDSSPLHDTSPCDTETDTDTLLPRQISSTSNSLPRSRVLSPTTTTTSSASKNKLSFDRATANRGIGAFYVNRPSLERNETDC